MHRYLLLIVVLISIIRRNNNGSQQIRRCDAGLESRWPTGLKYRFKPMLLTDLCTRRAPILDKSYVWR